MTEAIDAISRSSLEHELAAKERQVSLIACVIMEK